MSCPENPNWFSTHKVTDQIYLTRENHFFEGNRANCWLLKGPAKDIIIDTGLGVCNLRRHLVHKGLIEPPGGARPCEVVCTHVHFDHSGGAKHFEKVYIHEDDHGGLRHGRQVETLNYVKSDHFHQAPYKGFSARSYRVPPTECLPVTDRQSIDIGGREDLQIIHVPGHTKGSAAIYHEKSGSLFSGDFVYDSGSGQYLLDWLPNSCVRDYVNSAATMVDWIADHHVSAVYPGHFRICKADIVQTLLTEYIETKDNVACRCCMSCVQAATWSYFLCGCFRCGPC